MKSKFLLLSALLIVILFNSCEKDDNLRIEPTPLVPTITGFIIPAKVVGDDSFYLTPPISNSSGAFTYTSSNTAVATISDNTVTIVAEGTTSIIASQAAKGDFLAGDISADFVVAPPIISGGSRNIYVSVNLGNDATADPFSPSTPFKTIQAASNITMPGDVVNIMDGTYQQPNTTDANHIILDIKRSGAEGAYITYQPFPGAAPIIESKGQKWNAIIVNASYIIVKDLTLYGDNQALSLADAKAAEIDKRAGGTNWNLYSKFNTNGIDISGSNNPHHVEIRGCTVHDFPGGGIGGADCDYITIADNITYNNCWFGMWATSGISIFGPKNSDNTTGYKIKIIRNISYNNKPQVPYTSSASSKLSDGNGIIIDANNGTQGKVVYTGRTLVENNICYKNGGGGIHIFQAHRVDVINNTTFENEQVLDYANIDALYSDDIKFINNIAYAKSGGKANDSFNNTNVTFDYNIYFTGSVKEGGSNSKSANPLFVDAANGNFRLQSNSPAINAGTTNSITGTTYDIVNNPRIKNGRTDCGAYEIN